MTRAISEGELPGPRAGNNNTGPVGDQGLDEGDSPGQIIERLQAKMKADREKFQAEKKDMIKRFEAQRKEDLERFEAQRMAGTEAYKAQLLKSRWYFN